MTTKNIKFTDMKHEELIKVFNEHAERNLINGVWNWIKSCKALWGGDLNIKSENFTEPSKLIYVPQLNHLSALP